MRRLPVNIDIMSKKEEKASLKDITGLDAPLKTSESPTASSIKAAIYANSSSSPLSSNIVTSPYTPSWTIDTGTTYIPNDYGKIWSTTKKLSEDELFKYQNAIFNSNMSDEDKIKLIGILERLNN